MVIAVVRDVTERRATEEAARMNWAMFELLFERSPDAIFVVDELGRIERVNAAAEGALSVPGSACSAKLSRCCSPSVFVMVTQSIAPDI
jgi:PAS domain-containing protein